MKYSKIQTALVLVAALAGFSSAYNDIKGRLECLGAYNDIGQDKLLLKLAPCVTALTGTASQGCCDAALGLAGLDPNAPLKGCLCYGIAYNQVLQEVNNNPLAKQLKVTSDLVQKVLDQCKVPYFHMKNGCPYVGKGENVVKVAAKRVEAVQGVKAAMLHGKTDNN